MAIITFGPNPVMEALAAVAALNLWLSEQPKPEQATPAKARLTYDDYGDLRSMVVTLEKVKR